MNVNKEPKPDRQNQPLPYNDKSLKATRLAKTEPFFVRLHFDNSNFGRNFLISNKKKGQLSSNTFIHIVKKRFLKENYYKIILNNYTEPIIIQRTINVPINEANKKTVTFD